MPDRLRVLFITEDDPLHVIRLFEVFFREYPADAIEVCGTVSEAEFRQELGFEYDSSVFPTMAHDRYGRLTGVGLGEPIAELRPGFHEVSISCLPLGSRGLPWGGGGYFRIIPHAPWRAGIRRILRSGAPYMFYIHPWEIDPGQPRIRELGAVSRFRHSINLERCEGRFRALLDGFSWTTVRSVLDGWKREQAAVPAGFGSG